MSSAELVYTSATTLVRAIREKHVTSEEVITAYLARVKSVNPAAQCDCPSEPGGA